MKQQQHSVDHRICQGQDLHSAAITPTFWGRVFESLTSFYLIQHNLYLFEYHPPKSFLELKIPHLGRVLLIVPFQPI